MIDKIYKISEEVENKLRENKIHAEVFPYGHDMPVFVVAIHWGDWKHDHARAKWLVGEMGYPYINGVVTEEDGSDCYSAEHRFYVEGAYA